MKHANLRLMDMATKPRISKSAAITWAGSQALLADRLSVTPSAVSQWGEELPEGRAWQLFALGCPTEPERATSREESGQ